MAFDVARTGFILAALVMAAAPVAHAQDSYPNRPIRLVVGFAAGGPTDIPARFIADKLGPLLGQRVVVENKTGAGGMLATRDVLALPRDGYNLLLCTHFESINVSVYRNPQYKLDDLAPISLVSKYYYGITLSNSVPAEDLASFISYAKANPGKISYATIGAGSAQDIFGRQLERLTGTTMTAVPYRGGANVLQDLLTGLVQFYVAPTANVLPLAQERKIKMIATSSPERLKAAADVPTLREKGIDFVRFGWLAICAGAGTPEPILQVLNKHVHTIVASADYRELIEKSGSIPESSTPEELRRIIEQTRVEVDSTVKEFGLQRD
jgi:tripartite-type tricarboxylate transporter receptor subunit TctC